MSLNGIYQFWTVFFTDIGPQGLGILHKQVQENTHPDEEQKRTKMAMVDIWLVDNDWYCIGRQ